MSHQCLVVAVVVAAAAGCDMISLYRAFRNKLGYNYTQGLESYYKDILETVHSLHLLSNMLIVYVKEADKHQKSSKGILFG